MNGNGEGIKIPLKIVIGILGIAFTLGGGWFMVKDAPKEVIAVSRDLKEFKRDSHTIHHDTDERLRKVENNQVRLEANQAHMLTGIGDIKTILLRRVRHTKNKEEDGG